MQMQMDSRVKFRSPQNISGASQQNRAVAFFWTPEEEMDLFKIKKTKWQQFV